MLVISRGVTEYYLRGEANIVVVSVSWSVALVLAEDSIVSRVVHCLDNVDYKLVSDSWSNTKVSTLILLSMLLTYSPPASFHFHPPETVSFRFPSAVISLHAIRQGS